MRRTRAFRLPFKMVVPALVSATLAFAAFAAIASDSAYARAFSCNYGVCADAYYLSPSKAAVIVTLSRRPRVGDYVTQYYNRRNTRGNQYEMHELSPSFVIWPWEYWTQEWSVQACRKLTLRSRCTPWAKVGGNGILIPVHP